MAGPCGTPVASTSAEIYYPPFYSWDPSAYTFPWQGNMNNAREQHTMSLLPDGRVLIAGGYNDAGVVLQAEIFDRVARTFTAIGPILTGRYRHTATTLPNGSILLAGGEMSRHAEIFEPSSGTFRPTGGMTVMHDDGTATRLADGRVLFTGGFDNNAPGGTGPAKETSRAEIFYPKRLVRGTVYGNLFTDNSSVCDTGCNFFNRAVNVFDPAPLPAVVGPGVEFRDEDEFFSFTADLDSSGLTIGYENKATPNAVTSLRFRFSGIAIPGGITEVVQIENTFPPSGVSPAPAYDPIITKGTDWVEVRISSFGADGDIPPYAKYSLKLAIR